MGLVFLKERQFDEFFRFVASGFLDSQTEQATSVELALKGD
jgi:hypothetical protein